MESLTADTFCEVLIVGGGVSGILSARALNEIGVNCVLLDNHKGIYGTSLLQYEMDISLVELMEKRGMHQAQDAYLASYQSIDAFALLAEEVGCGKFARRKSVWLASGEEDVPLLKREYLARKDLGFDVELWSESDVLRRLSLSSPAALVSMKAAEFNFREFVENLLKDSIEKGVRAYERSPMISFVNTNSGIEARLDSGARIRAQYLIVAAGYDAAMFLPSDHLDIKNYYEMVTQPVDGLTERLHDFFISEIASDTSSEAAAAATYLHKTNDGRILIGVQGGEFVGFEDRNSMIHAKGRALRMKLKEYFPDLDMTPAYTWASTRCGAKDRLPTIGQIKDTEGCYFALGFEGNGISFSLLAAEVLRDLIVGKENPNSHILRLTQ